MKLREELEKARLKLEDAGKEQVLLKSTLKERDQKIQELDDQVLELQMSVQEMDLTNRSRDSTPLPFDEMGMSSSLLDDISIPGFSLDSCSKDRRKNVQLVNGFPSSTLNFRGVVVLKS